MSNKTEKGNVMDALHFTVNFYRQTKRNTFITNVSGRFCTSFEVSYFILELTVEAEVKHP